MSILNKNLGENGEIQNLDCILSSYNDSQYEYELECNIIEYPIQANLNNETGIGDKKNVRINITGDDSLSYSGKINNISYKKNSSGLSGGAIAGIVIACGAVLILATVLVLLFKRGDQKAIVNESNAVGLKSFDNY